MAGVAVQPVVTAAALDLIAALAAEDDVGALTAAHDVVAAAALHAVAVALPDEEVRPVPTAEAVDARPGPHRGRRVTAEGVVVEVGVSRHGDQVVVTVAATEHRLAAVEAQVVVPHVADDHHLRRHQERVLERGRGRDVLSGTEAGELEVQRQQVVGVTCDEPVAALAGGDGAPRSQVGDRQ